jgi:hypothetical protein
MQESEARASGSKYAWVEIEDEGGRWVTRKRPDERGRGHV